MKTKLIIFSMLPLMGLSGVSCTSTGQYAGPAVPYLLGPNTTTGLVTGAGLGALAGGLIANHNKVGQGIAKGAVAGGVIGGLIGYGTDRARGGDVYTGNGYNGGGGYANTSAPVNYNAPAAPAYNAPTGYGY